MQRPLQRGMQHNEWFNVMFASYFLFLTTRFLVLNRVSLGIPLPLRLAQRNYVHRLNIIAIIYIVNEDTLNDPFKNGQALQLMLRYRWFGVRCDSLIVVSLLCLLPRNLKKSFFLFFLKYSPLESLRNQAYRSGWPTGEASKQPQYYCVVCIFNALLLKACYGQMHKVTLRFNISGGPVLSWLAQVNVSAVFFFFLERSCEHVPCSMAVCIAFCFAAVPCRLRVLDTAFASGRNRDMLQWLFWLHFTGGQGQAGGEGPAASTPAASSPGSRTLWVDDSLGSQLQPGRMKANDWRRTAVSFRRSQIPKLLLHCGK